MAVRAEDIVRNSKVSSHVKARPPSRTVPRVTDVLKRETFELQCHERSFRVTHGISARDRIGHEPPFASTAAWIFGRRSADKLRMIVTLDTPSSCARRLL
jgi:hypothetical protein